MDQTPYGKIIIGVADTTAVAKRVKEIDGIDAKKVGKRFIVGVEREAKRLGLSIEKYFTKWKDAIKNSKLSDGVKGACLSGMDYNSYYGYGVIIISIPAQKELSYVGEEVFWRNGDATERTTSPKQIAEIAKRF